VPRQVKSYLESQTGAEYCRVPQTADSQTV